MKSLNLYITLLVVALIAPLVANGQGKRSKEFTDKYDLKEVVVLSRHNIRSPLSGHGSALGEMTPHEWNNWSAKPSELTQRGGALETIMGQYFGKWMVDQGLFPENYTPTIDEVNIYANSMQRCIATAQYFASGFMPTANLTVAHRFSPSKMDPIFNPQLTKDSPQFVAQAMKEIEAMGGKGGIVAYNEAIAPNYALIEEVLDASESPAAKAGKFKGFNDYNTKITLKKGAEPTMKGSLKDANSAADAFILQYYEQPNDSIAGFGHKLTRDQWKQIARVKDAYQDLLFTAPIVAVNVSHPLIQYINDELNADARKFTLLVGHDSNLGSVCTALGVEPFEAPEAIECKTPIGGKLVFEKWVDPATGEEFVGVNLAYQSVDQLRNMELLNLDNPPMVIPLKLKGLTANADGLYPMNQVNKRFTEVLAAYDAIPY